MSLPPRDSQQLERARRSGEAGMTIIELLAVLAIMSSLASIAIPKYRQFVESARVAHAIGDIQAIETTLDTRDSLPNGLAGLGVPQNDPWGRPYVYVKFPNAAPRVDRFGIQVNSTYDLYSLGKDGATATSLDAGASFDDVVRANDGGFIGLGSRY